MRQILILLLCCTIFKVNAATTITAGTLSSAHWTLTGSPYKITGHIIVANNDSLVIDPGVVVEFQGRYKLFCNGKIIANGTPSQHILFTVPVANQSIGWLGIRYDNTPTTNGASSFKYCTIEYGNADVSGDNSGGGMYFNNFSKCTISNSVIRNCHANVGGAVSCNSSSPTFLQDTFYNNSSNVGGNCLDLLYSSSLIDSCMFTGKGVYCMYSSIKVTNCYFNKCTNQGGVASFSSPGSGYVEIAHNVFDSCTQQNGGGGGGVLLSNAQGKIEHNIFKKCVAISSGGGAISCWTQTSSSNSNNVLISNNLIYGNKSIMINGTGATFGGGAISLSNCSGKVINNTIVNNTADTAGGGIVCIGGSSPSFHNNIIYNNTTKAGVENIFILDNASDPNFYNNDIQGGYAGINTNGTPLISANVNNIDSLPNFTNPSAGIYTLNTGSPCIDKGDITAIISKIPSKDLGGAVRVMGGKIDMGCYESLGSIPCDSPTNLRVNPITSTTAVVSWDTTTTAIGYEYYILTHPSTTPSTAVVTTLHTVLASGLAPSTTYDVCVRSKCAGGYSSWICDTFTTTSGLGIPQIATNAVSIYPNPSNGTFNISLENDSYTNATIMVYDLTGRMIASKTMSAANETMSLGNAAKGVYTVRILTNNTVHTRSITIQ